MRSKDQSMLLAGASIALALGGLAMPVIAAAASAVRPVYVEPVIPSHPYRGKLTVRGYQISLAGPGTGRLAVTSLTITNRGASTELVGLFSGASVNGSCNPGPVNADQREAIEVLVPSHSTLHLTYPSPLVFEPYQGATCVAATGLDGLDVDVLINGFVN